MPAELFPYCINNTFEKGITCWSTSIYSLESILKKTINFDIRIDKTYKDMENHIINSFNYEYSNGIVEGINNVIKQIKHTACGYKKFNHLKARVMLIKGLLNPIHT